MKKRILNNISWLFFDKIIRIFGSLVVGIWVARYLGPKQFGILNYGMAFVAMFSFMPNMGLAQIVVRDVTKYPEKANQILGSSLILKLLGSTLAAALIVLIVLNLNKTDALVKYVIILFSIGFIFQAFDVIDFFYQSQMLSKYVVFSRNITFIIINGIKIFLILHEYDLIWFVITATFGFFLDALFLIITYTKTHKSILSWRFDKDMAFELMKNSWPLMFSAFLISVHMKIDQVMIGNILDTKQVGIYSVAVRLAEFWYFIPSIIVSTLMPYFVELRENNNELYYFRLTQLYSLMFWMGIGVGVFVIFFGKDIIKVLFGSDYAGAYEALIFNIWAGIFVAQSSAKGIWVISENLQLYRIVANLVAVLINVSLNIALIPIYGISGAAIATLFTRFLNNWITPVLLIKPYRENTIISIKSINPLYVYSRRCCGKD